MRTCDLHTHSTASDGTLSPTEIAREAKKIGLSAIALTDHNTTKGLGEFQQACGQYGLECVCGAEFSTEYEGRELHLHGLFLPPDKWDDVEAYVEQRNISKRESNRKCCEMLENDGYPVSYEMFLEMFPDAVTPNRSNIADMLFAVGCAASKREAFDNFVAEGQKYYVPTYRMPFLETIKKIREWGAVPVWAHPLGKPGVAAAEAEDILKVATEHGLLGAEAHYTTYTDEEQQVMIFLCEHYGIVASGGSDFHGSAKPGIVLGTGYGSLQVPYEAYRQLAEYTLAD